MRLRAMTCVAAGAALLAGVLPATGGAAEPTAASNGQATANGQAGASGQASEEGTHPRWEPADKTGFGTARDRRSNVWFTLRGGYASELYYPDLSTPSVRSVRFFVSDGHSFATADSDATQVRTERLGGLTYRQTVRDPKDRWLLRKTYVTDPARPTVVVDTEFRSLTGKPYQLYAVTDPDLTNDGGDDSARVTGHTPVAQDGHTAAAMRATPAFTRSSAGTAGVDGGPTVLGEHYRLDPAPRKAGPGNVVLTGQTAADGVRSTHVRLSVGMGDTAARARSTTSRTDRQGFGRVSALYRQGWRSYRQGLPKPPKAARSPHERAVYNASVLMLAASEDKLHPGAFVASPSMPWEFGDNGPVGGSPSGTYHLVWPRDLYQIASGLLAAGDRGAAERALDFMLKRQQRPDGHLPQNTKVDGTPFWTSIQLDETAAPMMLAELLGRDDRATWQKLRKAAEYMISFRKDGHDAPYTEQERWEEQSGYSPSTIAAEIAGLVSTAEIADHNGAHADAKRYRRIADSWRAKIPQWTVTTNGPLSDRPYFLRLTKDGDANSGTTYNLGNSSATVDQRTVTDAGFLELVRLGIYPAGDPVVRNSLRVTDADNAVQTPTGEYWHRYTGDGYGETVDGKPWSNTYPQGSERTRGRAWPLLAGERGEYELLAGQPRSARARLADMAAAASSGDTLPEQVWGDQPPSGTAGHTPGRPTASATPLAWSHAQYLRLAWSLRAGGPVEYPDVVSCRYLHTRC